MTTDELFMEIEFERGLDLDDDCLVSFRDRYGSYRIDGLEGDGESERFDEMVELASSLRRRR